MAELKKVRASTLIEALVAMVIIMVSFTIAATIFLNIERGSNNNIKLRAYLLIENEVINTKSEQKYIDEEFDYESVIIKKTIYPYPGNEEVNILKFEAYDRDKRKILECREILVLGEDGK